MMINLWMIFGVIVSAWYLKMSLPDLLPYGPAKYVPQDKRPQFSSIDPTNDSLCSKHGHLSKIVPKHKNQTFQGAETIMFDQDGEMYVMTKNADLIHVTNLIPDNNRKRNSNNNVWLADVNVVAKLGLGKSLGGKIHSDSQKEKKKTLYFADSVMGLARLNLKDDRPKVELVATYLKDDTPLHFVDDIDIGTKTGHVYFSSATDIPNYARDMKQWQTTMYNSKIDFLRGKRTGKLLRYNPDTDEVDVLLDKIWFANGVAVDKDENFVLVVETMAARVLKYHLTGPKKGTSEVLLHNMTGYPDGVGCSITSGLCYVALYGSGSVVMEILYTLPSIVETFVRTLFMMMPLWILPSAKAYSGILEFDPYKGGDNNSEVRLFQDPTGKDIHSITGVTEHSGKLYLGSIVNEFIGVYDLDQSTM
uniref:Strictosidine synthase conserved region domain-containing protein n=1 Tax=Eucampia antarctica TaxID=49252 RepID=A0A7S2VXW8_9STRA|mmetsp:Transcript_10930/g.10443  ORF Transcript_10930/g.10443 Transcript_10930/m.10443 type:complete len:419 (+) Transcript_10930:75-1331(+)